MKTNVDFKIVNCFSLLLLYPISLAGEAWIKENIYLENWQDNGRIAIEPRYFDDIYEGIKEAGLTIKKR